MVTRARAWSDRHPVAAGAAVVLPVLLLEIGAGVLWIARAVGW